MKKKLTIPSAIDWWPTYKIYWQGGGPATTIRARTEREAGAIAQRFGATGHYTVHYITKTDAGRPDEEPNGKKEYDKFKEKEWSGSGYKSQGPQEGGKARRDQSHREGQGVRRQVPGTT